MPPFTREQMDAESAGNMADAAKWVYAYENKNKEFSFDPFSVEAQVKSGEAGYVAAKEYLDEKNKVKSLIRVAREANDPEQRAYFGAKAKAIAQGGTEEEIERKAMTFVDNYRRSPTIASIRGIKQGEELYEMVNHFSSNETVTEESKKIFSDVQSLMEDGRGQEAKDLLYDNKELVWDSLTESQKKKAATGFQQLSTMPGIRDRAASYTRSPEDEGLSYSERYAKRKGVLEANERFFKDKVDKYGGQFSGFLEGLDEGFKLQPFRAAFMDRDITGDPLVNRSTSTMELVGTEAHLQEENKDQGLATGLVEGAKGLVEVAGQAASGNFEGVAIMLQMMASGKEFIPSMIAGMGVGSLATAGVRAVPSVARLRNLDRLNKLDNLPKAARVKKMHDLGVFVGSTAAEAGTAGSVYGLSVQDRAALLERQEGAFLWALGQDLSSEFMLAGTRKLTGKTIKGIMSGTKKLFAKGQDSKTRTEMGDTGPVEEMTSPNKMEKEDTEALNKVILDEVEGEVVFRDPKVDYRELDNALDPRNLTTEEGYEKRVASMVKSHIDAGYIDVKGLDDPVNKLTKVVIALDKKAAASQYNNLGKSGADTYSRNFTEDALLSELEGVDPRIAMEYARQIQVFGGIMAGKYKVSGAELKAELLRISKGDDAKASELFSRLLATERFNEGMVDVHIKMATNDKVWSSKTKDEFSSPEARFNHKPLNLSGTGFKPNSTNSKVRARIKALRDIGASDKPLDADPSSKSPIQKIWTGTDTSPVLPVVEPMYALYDSADKIAGDFKSDQRVNEQLKGMRDDMLAATKVSEQQFSTKEKPTAEEYNKYREELEIYAENFRRKAQELNRIIKEVEDDVVTDQGSRLAEKSATLGNDFRAFTSDEVGDIGNTLMSDGDKAQFAVIESEARAQEEALVAEQEATAQAEAEINALPPEEQAKAREAISEANEAEAKAETEVATEESETVKDPIEEGLDVAQTEKAMNDGERAMQESGEPATAMNSASQSQIRPPKPKEYLEEAKQVIEELQSIIPQGTSKAVRMSNGVIVITNAGSSVQVSSQSRNGGRSEITISAEDGSYEHSSGRVHVNSDKMGAIIDRIDLSRDQIGSYFNLREDLISLNNEATERILSLMNQRRFLIFSAMDRYKESGVVTPELQEMINQADKLQKELVLIAKEAFAKDGVQYQTEQAKVHADNMLSIQDVNKSLNEYANQIAAEIADPKKRVELLETFELGLYQTLNGYKERGTKATLVSQVETIIDDLKKVIGKEDFYANNQNFYDPLVLLMGKLNKLSDGGLNSNNATTQSSLVSAFNGAIDKNYMFDDPLTLMMQDVRFGIPFPGTYKEARERLLKELNDRSFSIIDGKEWPNYGRIVHIPALKHLGDVQWVGSKPLVNASIIANQTGLKKLADDSGLDVGNNNQVVRVRFKIADMQDFHDDVDYNTGYGQVLIPVSEIASSMVDPTYNPKFVYDWSGTSLAPVDKTTTDKPYQSKQTSQEYSRNSAALFDNTKVRTNFESIRNAYTNTGSNPLSAEIIIGEGKAPLVGEYLEVSAGGQIIPVFRYDVEAENKSGDTRNYSSYIPIPPQSVEINLRILDENASRMTRNVVNKDSATMSKNVSEENFKNVATDHTKGEVPIEEGNGQSNSVQSTKPVRTQTSTKLKNSVGASITGAVEKALALVEREDGSQPSLIYYGGIGGSYVPGARNVYLREGATADSEFVERAGAQDAKRSADGNGDVLFINTVFDQISSKNGDSRKLTRSVDTFIEDLTGQTKDGLVVMTFNTDANGKMSPQTKRAMEAVTQVGAAELGRFYDGNSRQRVAIFDLSGKSKRIEIVEGGDISAVTDKIAEAINSKEWKNPNIFAPEATSLTTPKSDVRQVSGGSSELIPNVDSDGSPIPTLAKSDAIRIIDEASKAHKETGKPVKIVFDGTTKHWKPNPTITPQALIESIRPQTRGEIPIFINGNRFKLKDLTPTALSSMETNLGFKFDAEPTTSAQGIKGRGIYLEYDDQNGITSARVMDEVQYSFVELTRGVEGVEFRKAETYDNAVQKGSLKRDHVKMEVNVESDGWLYQPGGPDFTEIVNPKGDSSGLGRLKKLKAIQQKLNDMWDSGINMGSHVAEKIQSIPEQYRPFVEAMLKDRSLNAILSSDTSPQMMSKAVNQIKKIAIEGSKYLNAQDRVQEAKQMLEAGEKLVSDVIGTFSSNKEMTGVTKALHELGNAGELSSKSAFGRKIDEDLQQEGVFNTIREMKWSDDVANAFDQMEELLITSEIDGGGSASTWFQYQVWSRLPDGKRGKKEVNEKTLREAMVGALDEIGVRPEELAKNGIDLRAMFGIAGAAMIYQGLSRILTAQYENEDGVTVENGGSISMAAIGAIALGVRGKMKGGRFKFNFSPKKGILQLYSKAQLASAKNEFVATFYGGNLSQSMKYKGPKGNLLSLSLSQAHNKLAMYDMVHRTVITDVMNSIKPERAATFLEIYNRVAETSSQYRADMSPTKKLDLVLSDIGFIGPDGKYRGDLVITPQELDQLIKLTLNTFEIEKKAYSSGIMDRYGNKINGFNVTASGIDADHLMKMFHRGDLNAINKDGIRELLTQAFAEDPSLTYAQHAAKLLKTYAVNRGQAINPVKKTLTEHAIDLSKANGIQLREGDIKKAFSKVELSSADKIAARVGTDYGIEIGSSRNYKFLERTSSFQKLLDNSRNLLRQSAYAEKLSGNPTMVTDAMNEMGLIEGEKAYVQFANNLLMDSGFDWARLDLNRQKAQLENKSMSEVVIREGEDLSNIRDNRALNTANLFQATSKLVFDFLRPIKELSGTIYSTFNAVGMKSTYLGVRDSMFGDMDRDMINLVELKKESSMSHMNGLGYDANSRSFAGRMTDRGYKSLIENTLLVESLDDGKVRSQLDKFKAGFNDADSGMKTSVKKAYNGLIDSAKLVHKPFVAMYAGMMPLLTKKIKASPRVSLMLGYPQGKEIMIKDILQGNAFLPAEQMYRGAVASTTSIAMSAARADFESLRSKIMAGDRIAYGDMNRLKHVFDDKEIALIKKGEFVEEANIMWANYNIEEITGINDRHVDQMSAAQGEISKWTTPFRKTVFRIAHGWFDNIFVPALNGDFTRMRRLLIMGGMTISSSAAVLRLSGMSEPSDRMNEDKGRLARFLGYASNDYATVLPFREVQAVTSLFDGDFQGSLGRVAMAYTGAHSSTVMGAVGKTIDVARGADSGPLWYETLDWGTDQVLAFKEIKRGLAYGFTNEDRPTINPVKLEEEGVSHILDVASKQWTAMTTGQIKNNILPGDLFDSKAKRLLLKDLAKQLAEQNPAWDEATVYSKSAAAIQNAKDIAERQGKEISDKEETFLKQASQYARESKKDIMSRARAKVRDLDL